MQLIPRLSTMIDNVIVLGLPRGGVPIAWKIGNELRLPWNILLTRKIGVPSQPELAMGALTEYGPAYLNLNLIQQLSISSQQVDAIIAREQQELRRRRNLYKVPAFDVNDKHVVLVDDGMATGATMQACIQSLQTTKVRRLSIAVPVAAIDTLHRLAQYVDDVVCIHAVKDMVCIGQYYDDFSQLSDEDVLQYLHQIPSD